MFRNFAAGLRSKEIQKRILFTLALLFLYRVGSFIPVPKIDTTVFKAAAESSGLLNFMNAFSGGSLKNFSLFAVGIMPYITASIIIQLLQMGEIIPTLTEWSKQGEQGQKQIKKVTRYVTVVLAFIQALGLSLSFNRLYGIVIDPSIWTFLLIASILTIGTIILMIFGELITSKGIGNGMSMIIQAGIISSIPTVAQQLYQQEFTVADQQLFIHIIKVVLLLLVLLAMVVFVIFVQQGTRKIPIQYGQKMSAGKTAQPFATQSSFLPLKVNNAGVIPVIFAVALFTFPKTLVQFFDQNDVTRWISNAFDYTHPVGLVVYIALIILFAYFYAFMQVNPEKLAENLKKQNGYIPGQRPGKETQVYISSLLKRLTFIGALFLSFVSALPVLFSLFANIPTQLQIGGISLLIVTSVAIDTVKQIESKTVSNRYTGFIQK